MENSILFTKLEYTVKFLDYGSFKSAYRRFSIGANTFLRASTASSRDVIRN